MRYFFIPMFLYLFILRKGIYATRPVKFCIVITLRRVLEHDTLQSLLEGVVANYPPSQPTTHPANQLPACAGCLVLYTTAAAGSVTSTNLSFLNTL